MSFFKRVANLFTKEAQPITPTPPTPAEKLKADVATFAKLDDHQLLAILVAQNETLIKNGLNLQLLLAKIYAVTCTNTNVISPSPKQAQELHKQIEAIQAEITGRNSFVQNAALPNTPDNDLS